MPDPTAGDGSTQHMHADHLIDEYGVLERTPDALQSVVELAAYVADVPKATINIITTEHQHQIAAVGFDAAICRREDSMCAIGLHHGRPIAIPDASADHRYRDNPFVTGELGGVRFYANHPLVLRGVPIGTLCVFDDKPREVDHGRRALLASLADRVVDILELERQARRLQTALDQAQALRDELARSNDRLSAFAGQISHDLASPLTAIAFSLELLQEQFDGDPATPAPVTGWIDSGLRGVARMEAMIHDILAYARVGGQLRHVPVDLAEPAQAAAADLCVPAGDPRIVIGELPTVYGDPTQLRAVFQNLLSNGLKFGGDDPRVEVVAVRGDDAWRIEVADRGIGIDPGDVHRVFDPLVRAQKEIDGSGIGLSTCRRVVQAHGGDIGIRPREGGGAVAWFTIPFDHR
ncbi:sensor histidine kinase [Microbacterium sp. GXF7504]